MGIQVVYLVASTKIGTFTYYIYACYVYVIMFLEKTQTIYTFKNKTFLSAFENILHFSAAMYMIRLLVLTSSFAKKKPVDFDDELKIGDVRYDNMTNITIKQQLF